MINENISGEAELAFAKEIASITGMDTHTKEAAAKEAPEGTPAEDRKPLKKEAALAKVAADMDMADLFEDENFRRGVFDEIESQRHVWEPVVKERLFGIQE